MSHKNIFLKSAFVKTPGQNGIGRHVCQLRRLVVKFCLSHGSSRGIREHLNSDLLQFSRENPGVVVYVKPRRHRSSVLIAEYLNGDKQYVSCDNFTREEVVKWINLLKTQQQNRDGTRLRKLWHTEHPSIQGPWTPYMFRDPALNLAEFPNSVLSEPLNLQKSATDVLTEMFKNQKLED